MPSAAIRIDLRIGRLRQRAVDSAALLQPGRPIHSRANQRMTENHSRTQLQQPFRFDGFATDPGFRDVAPPAKRVPGRRPDQLPQQATSAARHPEARPAAA